jgi:hypothetical protein
MEYTLKTRRLSAERKTHEVKLKGGGVRTDHQSRKQNFESSESFKNCLSLLYTPLPPALNNVICVLIASL